MDEKEMERHLTDILGNTPSQDEAAGFRFGYKVAYAKLWGEVKEVTEQNNRLSNLLKNVGVYIERAEGHLKMVRGQVERDRKTIRGEDL